MLEHVRDVDKTLKECHRVSRPQGSMCVVFPSFYHPIAHHLSLATKFPCIHYLFSGDSLVKAYREVIEKRGDAAVYYKRRSNKLLAYEKGNTLNGITRHSFDRSLCDLWRIKRFCRRPLGSVGRHVESKKIYSIISAFLYPLTFIPYVDEALLHRMI